MKLTIKSIIITALLLGSATADIKSITAKYSAATTTVQAASDVRITKLISRYLKALTTYEDKVRANVKNSDDLEKLVAVQTEIKLIHELVKSDAKADLPEITVADVKLKQLRDTFLRAYSRELNNLDVKKEDLAKVFTGYLRKEEQSLIEAGELDEAIKAKEYREGLDGAVFQDIQPREEVLPQQVMVITNPALQYGYARVITKDSIALTAGVTYTFTARVRQGATDSGLEAVDGFPVFLSETDVKGQFSSNARDIYFEDWDNRKISHGKQDSLGFYEYKVEFTVAQTHKALMRFQTYMDRTTYITNVQLTASDSNENILPSNIINKRHWQENLETFFKISFEDSLITRK